MNSICSIRLRSLETPEIEQIWLKITTNSNVFILGTIYRPPSYSAFFEHFDMVLDKVWVKYKNRVIVGDFNCDLTSTASGTITSPLGNKLHSSLAQRNFVVVNNQATRVTTRLSTLIDLVVTNDDSLIKHIKILDLGISDHMLVYAAVRTKIRRLHQKSSTLEISNTSTLQIFARDIESAPGRYVR